MTTKIDTARIAELLGVSRVYVTDRISKRPDFPKPVVNVSSRIRYWDEAEVLDWARGDQPRREAISAAVSR